MEFEYPDTIETDGRIRAVRSLLFLIMPEDDEWREIIDEAFISDESLLSDFLPRGVIKNTEGLVESFYEDYDGDIARIQKHVPVKIDPTKYLFEIIDDIWKEHPKWGME